MRRGELRIVGGILRSRRIRFSDAPGLRPTADRLRETLFNWLGPWIEGRRVLDLYAGSGALGIEALSRGAREAVFVEHSAPVAATLRANLALLAVGHASVECRDALAFLRDITEPFDLVFLDPPWTSKLLPTSLAALAAGGWLSSDNRVYVERPFARPGTAPPPEWRVLASTRVGAAAASLLAH